MSEFHWTPSPGARTKDTFRVREAQFGDGYSQSYPEGLNSLNQTFNLQFRGTVSYIDEIVSFLRSKKGASEFTFTPPSSSEEVKVVCKTWDREDTDRWTSSLTCEFVRVYR